MSAAPMSKRAMEFVLASLHPGPRVWDLYPTMQAAEDDAPRVNAKEHPDTADFAYTAMTYEAFAAGKAAHYLNRPLVKITEERWHEMLNVLPPMAWEHRDGVERFMVCEALDAVFHDQFARCDGRYYSRTVDASKRSTWITRAMVEEFLRAPKA